MRFPGPTHLVVGFEHRHEAERFLAEFQERLAEYEGEPESFVFLGFTHSCGTNGAGYFTIWRRSVRKRVEAKLQEVKQTLRARLRGVYSFRTHSA